MTDSDKMAAKLSPFCYEDQETLAIKIPKDFLGKYRANLEEVTREANKFVLDLIWSKEDPNENRDDFLRKMTKEKSLDYVAKDIFGKLDHKSLLKAREVSHGWKEFIDQETGLWTKLFTVENYKKAAEEFKAIDTDTSKPLTDSQRKEREKQRLLNERSQSIRRNMAQLSKVPNPKESCIVTLNNNPEVYQGRSLPGMRPDTCTTHGNIVVYYPLLLPNDCGNGATALHRAAYYGHRENVETMMNRLDDKSPKDRFGRTPLIYAIKGLHYKYRDYRVKKGYGDHLQVISYIIEKSDQVNQRDNFDSTPLAECVTALSDLILDGDENIDFMIPVLMNILSVTENKNPADCLGVTPLHQIARVLKPWELENRIFTEKHREVMSLLLQNVEDKHPKDEDGKTPADYLLRSFESCWFGAISAARYGDECKTLFELAQKYGYGEIWKILKCPLP